MRNLEVIITSRERDLGGFSVHRLLPFALRRMVGPFIFFDHIGPVEFGVGQGMDVRPHPHIGLATVTYLFDGKIQHRDSLGSDQIIEPGDINWMTAGHGIVHSERTPIELRETGGRMHGIQLWVALPQELEEVAPSFVHHPARSLPEFEFGEVKLKLLLGKAFGFTSPVEVHSDLFYLEARIPKGAKIVFPGQGMETAAYVVQGSLRVQNEMISQGSMAVAEIGNDLQLEALESSLVMFLGGKPIGERLIYWNFVSSSKERLDRVKEEWRAWPHAAGSRFHPILRDNIEFIPLPLDTEGSKTKGTIM